MELVKWLVEKEDCPLSVRRDPKSGMLCSVQTSARRTLIDLAMTGKPKIEILSFLIQNSLSIVDAKDPKLAPKTLETLLGAGFRFEKREGEVESFQLVESCDTMSIGTLEDAVSFLVWFLLCVFGLCVRVPFWSQVNLTAFLLLDFCFVIVHHLLREANGLRSHSMWASNVL